MEKARQICNLLLKRIWETWKDAKVKAEYKEESVDVYVSINGHNFSRELDYIVLKYIDDIEDYVEDTVDELEKAFAVDGGYDSTTPGPYSKFEGSFAGNIEPISIQELKNIVTRVQEGIMKKLPNAETNVGYNKPTKSPRLYVEVNGKVVCHTFSRTDLRLFVDADEYVNETMNQFVSFLSK